MQNPFLKDNYLLPNVSLNKLQMLDLGDLELRADIRGKFALDLVSAEFFNKRLDGFFEDIGIVAYNADKYNRFIECFLSGDERLQSSAESIIIEIGENLGYILLALKRGDLKNREARKDWTDEHWDYWCGIERVVLSGGLTYSVIGERLKRSAEELFARTNQKPYELDIAKDSEYLPLIGAFQRGATESENIVIMDFGHTYVKRGYAVGDRIYILDKIQSIVHTEAMIDEPEPDKAKLLNNFIVGVLVETCLRMEQLSGHSPDVVAISIANYVYKGEIYYHRGEYGKLTGISGNYEKYLSEVLSERLGRRMRVLLIHDGTAAAYGVNHNQSAVITLGTGLGVGFCDMSAWPYKNYAISKK